MKTNKIFVLILLVFAVFTSCKKEPVDTGDPYFNFNDATEQTSPTGYNVDYKGNTAGEKYIIRSNRNWTIVENGTSDWVRFFPNEGDDDGIVNVIVSENKTFEDRTTQFKFMVAGQEQPVMFTVTQAKATPYLTIKDVEKVRNLNQIEQILTVPVQANVQYTYTSNASWMQFSNTVVGTLGTDLNFTVSENTASASRTGTILFTCAQFPALNVTLTVKQEGKSEGTIVFFEDFSWLGYGSPIFYTTTGETRMDLWTEVEKGKGWTSTPNPGSSMQPLVYARKGFIKLGKTGFGGDIITPKLTGIVGTKNVLVKFKAVPYMTAAGTKDDTDLKISLKGPGTLSTAQFNITNWPNYTEDPTCTAIWEAQGTERNFTITGATSETQIVFLGGALYLTGIGVGKNRIFLDDIKVLIPN